jgi:hypothetical protein
MAITPNVAQEQASKLTLRANTRGGDNVVTTFDPIDPAIMVNALAQTSGVLRLTGVSSTCSFTISGSAGGNSSTITGTAAVSGLVTALGTGPLANIPFFVNAGPAQLLKGNTGTATSTGGAVVDIIVPSGVVLTVISGTGSVPTLTAVTLTGTLATVFPNYGGTPNATPTWVDGVTVHYYPVGYAGQITNALTLSGTTAPVVQTQVRQINTQLSETQEYDGYFLTYSGNLYQTGQKRTYRQQS